MPTDIPWHIHGFICQLAIQYLYDGQTPLLMHEIEKEKGNIANLQHLTTSSGYKQLPVDWCMQH